MALIYKRQVEPMGFKGNGMFIDSQWHQNYYRVFEKECVVIGIGGGVVPDGVWRFDLIRAQMKSFKKGRLGLVPPGCCYPTRKRQLSDFKWVFEGTIKNLRHLKQILAGTGLFPELR